MFKNVLWTIAASILFSVASGTETVTVVDIQGTKSTGSLKSWSSDSLTISSTPDREFRSNEIRSVLFEPPPSKQSGIQPAIWLSNGDQISARAVSIADDLLVVSWPARKESSSLKIPLEHVRALIFEWPTDLDERLRLIADLQTLPPGNDLVMLTNGDRSLGTLERLDAAHVELKVATNTQKLDRSRVRAIRMNPELTAEVRHAEKRAIFALTDGSQLAATSISLTDDLLSLHSPLLNDLTLPVNVVQSCHLFSEALIPLSDYEPAKIEFTPYLSAKWPLIRNANVRRGPLKLRGNSFATGLGMHSRMVVTYNLKGGERSFQATVGIDDIAEGKGSAVFAVELEGRRVWTSTELTGRSPAVSFPAIDLQGAKQLTLLVEFGQFADVCDYADWCDAVLSMDPAR